MIYDDFTAETKRTLNLATNCGCLILGCAARATTGHLPHCTYAQGCPSLESFALRRLGTGLAHFMTSKFRWFSTKDDQHYEHLWNWLVYYWQPRKKFVVPLAPHFLSQTQIVDDEKVDTTCLCWRLVYRTCVFVFFLADGVGWVGVGWGGLITFNGTSTHIWCYTSNLVSCTCTHTWCYATDLVSCTCTHTWCYATDLVSCTCTHTWCYATDGLGWGGLITFNGTSTHTWCYATGLCSCTCTHSWCYATDLVSCTCTHSWCYATRLFSCTSTHSCARKNRKVRIFCSLPVAKRKSIKKQGILKQPLSTPGVHKSVQKQVKNDEKIKHNGISHIFWPNMMMIASKVLQIPRDKHEGHHKDS